MKTGVELIADERERQISQEGYDAQHDDDHDCGELADAAICYALEAGSLADGFTLNTKSIAFLEHWPFDLGWWKPSDDPIRNLVKAGALIAAEIDRLQCARSEKG